LARAVRAERRRAVYRALVRVNPVEERTVLFESYVGSGYSCSPKALYQAMLRDRRFDGYTLIWALKRPEDYAREAELARATLVKWGSPEYFAAYAKAKYWMCNCAVPAEVSPREDQIYVQTWHGTPLKRFGCDITPAGIGTRRAAEARLRRWRSSAAKFTWLLSQSSFASEKLTSALGLDPVSAPRVIRELGYPRNDFLSAFEASDVARIRSRLGLPEGKKVVLYAPTWRDDQRTPGAGYNLQIEVDFDRLRAELGDGYVVLFRAHFMIADAFDFARYDGFVRDVSGVDDVNDLYVVSDVLVTDYSSVFFDYANLERPVVFYMYDLDRYAADRGGFYLNLDELPGPIVRDQDDLASAISSACDARTDPDAGMRYRAFRERFAPLDDGHAGERVLDHVFGVKEEDWKSR
jgi:CDP-glycerol glycerophosphotransferase